MNPVSRLAGRVSRRRHRHRPPTVIITGGGTAGHTNPGIAVAEALVDAGIVRDRIHFVGGERGNERTLVGEAGFSIDLLPGRGIQRKLTPKAVSENIGAVAGLLTGVVKSFAIVAKRRPRVVMCLGGYAAFAASAAAFALRIPIVVSEQNAKASAVNRLFGRVAAACALPFPGTDLPKGVVTGNPIRQSIVDSVAGADRGEALDRMAARIWPDEASAASFDNPLTSRTLVSVWSGSLGATTINQAVSELADRWVERDDIALYHVIGRRDWALYQRPIPGPEDEGLCYVTVDYEDHMADVLVGSQLAVCRSGASTVAELAVAGLPSILVPLPIAPRDAQRANADQLADAGGAVVVADNQLDADRLGTILEPLIEDRSRRATMAQAASSAGRPLAAHDVAKLLNDIGGLDDDER